MARAFRRMPATRRTPVPSKTALAGSGVEIGSENVTSDALVIETLPIEVITQPEEQLNSPMLSKVKGPTAPRGVLKL